MKDLVIVKDKDKVITSLFDGNELVEVQIEDLEAGELLGKIYLGKVKNIISNINAAFVEIEGGRMCYLSLDEVVNPVCAGVFHDGPLRAGDEIIVQITKEGSALKAPQATADFCLTGRYLVLVHGRNVLGISKKVEDPGERTRLKSIVGDFTREKCGFIIRTNAMYCDEAMLRAEAENLLEVYDRLVTEGVHRKPFSLLYRTKPSYIWAVRDLCSTDIDRIRTNDEEIFDSVIEYMKTTGQDDTDKVELYISEGPLDLCGLYKLKDKIEDALKERVWLESGAFLVIQPTEACTVIDVNTGKAVSGKKGQQETFFRINIEAAREVAKQLRLRNLSGIIIIDFIDMVGGEHREALMKELRDLCKEDRIPTRVVDMTKLNLVEITRKKTRKPLAQQV
ncbi:MAG: ribonuclease E/G [Lachnospiraceae bacterium]|nr:ribonuclease E/G [Lachnospiraceae bacterium]